MIKDKDYDRLKYPIHKKDPSKIPSLMALSGLSMLDDKEIKYLIYMYDKSSPLNEISDVKTRKEFAADIAGFDVDKDDISYLYDLKKLSIRKALVSLLRDQFDMEYAALITFEHRFFENLTHLLEPLDQEDGDINTLLKGVELKSKIENSTKVLIESINGLRDKIFGGDNQLLDITETFTPESIATKVKKNV